MSEIMVNLKGTELGDRLEVDLISVESLIGEFEDTLYEMDYLKKQIKEYENPNNYDTTEDFLEAYKRHIEMSD